MSGDDKIQWTQDGHVAVIALADPATSNSLSPAMIEEVCAAIDRADTDESVHCVIVTGQGKSFCSGGNLHRMLEPVYRDASPAEIVEQYRRSFHRIPLALDALSKPSIAAINGHAIGAGLDLACYCDIRIACDDARFASSFVKLGLIPGDGGAWILPQVVGRSRAIELMLSGETINTARAGEIGLISRSVPREALMGEAMRVAQTIAANPPHAAQMAKKLERASRQLDLQMALELAGHMQAAAHKTDAHVAAVEAMIATMGKARGAKS